MTLLVDLPAELLSRIAAHLFRLCPSPHGSFEDNGFYSLRLSCRCVEAKTRYLFEKAAFTTVAVTLHARSLQRLQSISSHPRFGRLVKKLVFSKTYHPVYDDAVSAHRPERARRKHEYAGYGVIELPRESVDGVYPNEGLTLRKRVRLGLQDLFAKVMAFTPNLQDVVIEPNFMASFWLDSPSRQDQLNEAAQRIYQSTSESIARQGARYGEGYEDEDADSSDSDFEIMDSENQDYDNDDYDDPYHLETYVYPDYLAYLSVKAAHQQGLQLSSLSSINVNASSVRARTVVELAPALRSLQHLRLSINANTATKLVRMNGSALHDHANGKPTAKSFGHALSTLRDLKSLELTFDDYYWEDDRLSNVSRSLIGLNQHPFERLSDIDLRFACFEGKTLCYFLYNQRAILQQLTLHHISLTTMGHWRPVLALLLREVPMLVKLRCSKLTGGEGFDTTQIHPFTEGWKDCCNMHCCGREEVLMGLQRVLSCFPGAPL